MGSSGFAQISWGEGYVDLSCTDSEVLESVLEELEKLVPSYRVEKTESFSGEIYWCRIDKIRHQEVWDVGFWVMKQLCLQGWEPFVSTGSSGLLISVSLRRSVAA